MPSVARRLHDRVSTVIVRQDLGPGEPSVFWRVRRLDPLDFVGAGEPVGTLASVPSDGGQTPPPDGRGMLDEARRVLRVACAAVEALSDDGVEWESVRLVTDRTEEDPDASVLHVTVLSRAVLASVVRAALADAEEARKLSASFLDDAGNGLGPRHGSGEVRSEAL